MNSSRFRILLNYLSPYQKKIFFGILNLIIANALIAYIPLLIRDEVNNLKTIPSLSQIALNATLILFFASLQWGTEFLYRGLLFEVALNVEFDNKQKLFSHLLEMDTFFFSKNKIGDLINRATSDITQVRYLIVFIFISLINAIFAYAFTLPIMLSINFSLSLLVILIFLFLPLIVHFIRDKLNIEQHIIQKELSNLSTLIQEDINGISVIKMYVQEDNECRSFHITNQKLLKANIRLAKIQNILLPALKAIGGICLVVIIWLGSINITNDNYLNSGNFIALILYVERLIYPTALIGISLATYQTSKVSFDRVEAILKLNSQIKSSPNAIPLLRHKVKGRFTAENLNFTYPNSTKIILKNINFTINPGETIAIVGPINSGKSTLIKTFPRLLNIESRQLYLDNIDITKLRLQSLRETIAYVPQETVLFKTTIENNIRYGNPLAKLEEVKKAAMYARIHDEILNFPKQYNTIVGTGGSKLSGGQQLRISLARAILMDAPIIILDSPLSSIDNQISTDILENLVKHTKQKTIILVTHQISVASIADRVFVMEQGQISERGTHEELVRKSSFYRLLWNQQQQR